MSDVQAQVPADHPLMVAWTTFKTTPEFANIKKWMGTEPRYGAHDGALWAAFMAGFQSVPQRELDHGR